MFYVILTGDEAPSRARPFQTQQRAEHHALIELDFRHPTTEQ